MSAKTVIVCDREGCGKQKTETNHWFVQLRPVNSGGLWFDRMANVPADVLQSPQIRHYCGQACLSQVFQQWMDAGPPAAAAAERKEAAGGD